jgi:RNA polymerase sigma-70 factor (ECF subfamily)
LFDKKLSDEEFYKVKDYLENKYIFDETFLAKKQQNLAQLLQYIKQLKPAYQEVIQMRYFQEMTYQEMAEQIDEPLNNIKIKLLRAKKLLAEIISGK